MGINPWLDIKNLLPGQQWKTMISQTIRKSTYFIALLSNNSINKRGFAQKELKIALDILDEMPQCRIFIIPVRVNDCEVADERLQAIHWADISTSYETGFQEIMRVLAPTGLYREESFEEKLSRYFRITSQFDILPQSQWPEEIKVQPSHFRDVFFQQINGREAIRGKTYAFDEIRDRFLNKMSIILIIGEAGIGKTTFCRWFSKELITACKDEFPNFNQFIPVLISLREFCPDNPDEFLTANVLNLGISLRELSSFAGRSGKKLLFFFDGLNELADSQREAIVSEIYSLRNNATFDISIIFTSRSVGVTEKLCSLMGNSVIIYEMQRWNDQQLCSYLMDNKMDVSRLSALSQEMRRSLCLPLFAWLFIQTHRSPLAKPIITIGDIFNAFIETWLAPQENDSEKYQSILKSYDLSLEEKKGIIDELAFQMTQKNTVVVNCGELETCMRSDKRNNFVPLALDLINSGIFRCVGMAALNPMTDMEKLRGLKVMFLHQAFQEYLTAEYLSKNHEKTTELPVNLSKDAFWRDVPIFMMRLIDQSTSAGRKKAFDFVKRFLDINAPDFWTAARLANELNAIDQNQMKQKIVEMLISDLSHEITYANNIDAFSELQEISRRGLLDELNASQYIESIVSKTEFHLHRTIDKEIYCKIKDEQQLWRSVGRPIAVLGELGEVRFIELILPRLHKIRSIHLIYHVLEAFLLIIRLRRDNDILFKQVIEKIQELNWLNHDDPVIGSCCLAIMREVITDKDESGEEVAQKLIGFLKRKASPENQYFEEEYWQRAHGIIVLPEVSEISKAINLMQEMLSIENIATYGEGKFRGYIAVHSATLTSVSRAQLRLNVGFKKMRGLLETILQSGRLSENVWACRGLENLLLMVCTEKEKRWLEDWLSSQSLPEGTKRVLRNVAHVLVS
jgi:hypothetical protein